MLDLVVSEHTRKRARCEVEEAVAWSRPETVRSLHQGRLDCTANTVDSVVHLGELLQQTQVHQMLLEAAMVNAFLGVVGTCTLLARLVL